MNTPPQPGDLPTSKCDDEAAGAPRTKTEPSSSTEVTGSSPNYPLKGVAPESQEIPERFGRYVLVKKLGRGGMGTVYLAQDTQLDRPVALKIPHFNPEHGAQVLERFYREARSAALLRHPNICPVYDVGEIEQVPYLTMAYIEGQTLLDWAEQHPERPEREVALLVQKVALALEDAHAHHIIHRDLKPSNIMIDKRREPVVMDFGLARRVNMGDERLTHQGVVMGTPAYMSPEQMDPSEEVGPASDIYSLGVILYELLTGQLPFEGSLTAMLAQIVAQEPRPPSFYRPDLDPALEAICRKALAKDPQQRYASMADFAEALQRYLSGQETLPRPSSPCHHLPSSDARLADEVLHLLRTWGWAAGLKKLKTQIQHIHSDRNRAALQVYAEWLAGDRNVYSEAVERLKVQAQGQALSGWALAAQAIVALRERDYARAHQVLERAAALGVAGDRALAATLAHTRGVAYFHQGKSAQALPELHEALALFGKDHFAIGRVLDTLGMVYASKGNFHIAREFYEQALQYKQRSDDESGLALSHGQLGRLHLDWGHLDKAEEHFQEDLRLAQKILDGRGEAQMYNHLGQVALARGQREAAAGRKATARRLWTEASGWLEESIRLSQDFKLQVAEGYARKDRALVFLQEGNIAEAENQAHRAEELFTAANFAEGKAQIHGVWGMLLRTQERYEEALRKLRAALAHFEDTQDSAEAARIQWEIARTLRASAAHAPLVTRAFLDALDRAEGCRRDTLVERIEEELSEVDQEAYFRHVYCRVRGRDIHEDTTSLIAGSSEVVTVLCFDLQGFSDYARGLDPEEVLRTLNQMMADLAVVLERYRAKITTYFGDGFLALLREGRHAERGVNAALDLMAALQEFDRPREILGLQRFKARIGITTGSAFLGNVGTYHKIDFTVLGPAVTLAARLLNWAEPGLPCISQDTYELLPEHFVYQPGNPRTVQSPGVGAWAVWDVAGRKK